MEYAPYRDDPYISTDELLDAFASDSTALFEQYDSTAANEPYQAADGACENLYVMPT